MKTQNMRECLSWLINYLQENKPAELKKLAKSNASWGNLECMNTEAWISDNANTKSGLSLRIEDILKGLKKISSQECGDAAELRKSALRAIAELMGIEKYNHNISRNELEDEIIRFIEASA